MLSVLENAKQVSARLRNPINGRMSEESEVVSAPELRRRRIQQIKEIEAARKTVAWEAAFETAIARERTRQANAIVEIPLGQIPTINQVIAITCVFYDISAVEIISQRRNASLVRARHVACYLAKTLTPKSFPEIGRRLGNRDHTSIMHAVRSIEAKLTTEPGMQSEITQLKRHLGCA